MSTTTAREAVRDAHVDPRRAALTDWVRERLQTDQAEVSIASADASFRRYFRVRSPAGSHIVMDAPPEREDCAPYIDVARRLRQAGLEAPAVLAQDLDQGFLLISDLGDDSYLKLLDGDSVEDLYGQALDALLRIQTRVEGSGLPAYDAPLLAREMELFPTWFLGRHLGLELAPSQSEVLAQTFRLLIESALAQPACVVHRDYHSRNLMRTPEGRVGILDFQDAVLGPVTYDLVSLLRDCYIAWPQSRVRDWMEAYRRRLHPFGLALAPVEFERAFDFMGVQRHLKAIGIFARLYHRDGKPGYLGDIPRTLGYVLEASARHDELAPLHALLQSLDLPRRLGERGPDHHAG